MIEAFLILVSLELVEIDTRKTHINLKPTHNLTQASTENIKLKHQ